MTTLHFPPPVSNRIHKSFNLGDHNDLVETFNASLALPAFDLINSIILLESTNWGGVLVNKSLTPFETMLVAL